MARDRTVQERFTAALDALVEQVRRDRTILAALLCGSLSHDAVWSHSDIDLVLITQDDRKSETEGLTLFADGVNVHAMLIARAEFRKMAEGTLRHSFMHSFLAKGRLLYAHDETINGLCARLQQIGERDTQVQLFQAATNLLPLLYKAHKFWVTRRDLDYTALWMLAAAAPLAQLEVIGARVLVEREVIPQAVTLNPALFKTVYSDLLNTRKTAGNVQAALDTFDRYLAERASELFSPVIAYLREAGDMRTCTEIDAYFTRNMGVHGVITACEYLADQGLIGKASTVARLTKRNNVEVQELAFYDTGNPPDAF